MKWGVICGTSEPCLASIHIRRAEAPAGLCLTQPKYLFPPPSQVTRSTSHDCTCSQPRNLGLSSVSPLYCEVFHSKNPIRIHCIFFLQLIKICLVNGGSDYMVQVPNSVGVQCTLTFVIDVLPHVTSKRHGRTRRGLTERTRRHTRYIISLVSVLTDGGILFGPVSTSLSPL